MTVSLPPRYRPYNQVPYDPNIGDQLKSCLDSMLATLNQLTGQTQTAAASNVQTFGANIIDPTSAQINSAGSRMSSITTAIRAVMGTTSAQFFWDGSNGSQPFKIYRDDGTIYGPSIAGSGITCTGLTASTTYYFYPYFNEALEEIKFATLGGVSVGTPAIAFTSQSNLAAQQQILRGNIPLAFILSSTGAATPATGTSTVNGGSGGGGAGVGGNGRYLP
jgi:hypothetical protein